MDPVCPPYVSPKVIYQRRVAWLKKNAQPRHIPRPPKIDRGPPYQDSGRLEELSKARYSYTGPKDDPTSWVYLLMHPVKEAALNYNISGYTEALAQPRGGNPGKPNFDNHPHFKPRQPLVKLSDRMEFLSTPRIYKVYKPRPPVSRAALKAKASARTITLSTPIIKKDEPKEFAFTVNPITFKYFASKRTRQMAKPRTPMTQKQLDAKEEKHKAKKEAYDIKRAAKLEAQKKKIQERHKAEQKSLGI